MIGTRNVSAYLRHWYGPMSEAYPKSCWPGGVSPRNGGLGRGMSDMSRRNERLKQLFHRELRLKSPS